MSTAPAATPLFGVYRAVVTATDDPENQDRVRVTIASLPQVPEAWATRLLPDGAPSPSTLRVGDSVLVAFEAGDPDHPIVMGAFRRPG